MFFHRPWQLLWSQTSSCMPSYIGSDYRTGSPGKQVYMVRTCIQSVHEIEEGLLLRILLFHIKIARHQLPYTEEAFLVHTHIQYVCVYRLCLLLTNTIMSTAPTYILGLSDCMNFDITIIFIKTSRFSIISDYKNTTV